MHKWFIFVSLSLGLTTSAFSAPIKTTLCAIRANVSAFDKKDVTVSADAWSDGLENQIIYDDRCPKLGAYLVFTRSYANTEDARRILHIFYHESDHGWHKKIHGEFQGTVIWERSGRPSVSLHVNGISNMTIRPSKPRNLDDLL